MCNELNKLQFRCFETDLYKEQKELLRKAGFYVYDLRAWDEGNGYSVETHVVANHIGCWITDMDLQPYMHENTWLCSDEFNFSNISQIPYKEIEIFLIQGREIHFKNYHG